MYRILPLLLHIAVCCSNDEKEVNVLVAEKHVAVADERCSMSMLQRDSRALRKGDEPPLKSCLSFIHIPKNMGGTIQLAGNNAFGVPINTSAGCLWREVSTLNRTSRSPRLWGSCDDRIACSPHGAPTYRCGWELGNPAEGVPPGFCDFQHYPPAFDAKLAASYTSECDSFCIIRHPLDRFISGFHWIRFHYRKGLCCSAECLENFAKRHLQDLNLDFGCLIAPQVYYVFEKGDPTQDRICRHVLNMTSIQQDFPKLMKRYGLKVDITGVHEHEDAAEEENCDIDPTPATVELVKKYYAKDYAAFGFS